MIWGVVVLWDVRLGDYFYRNVEEPGLVIWVGVVILFVGIVLHLFETTNSPTSGVPTQEILDGPVETFYENGQLSTKGTYKDGKLDGPYESYWSHGALSLKGTYKDNEKCGEWFGVTP